MLSAFSSSAWRRTLQVGVGNAQVSLCLVAEVLNSITSVKGGSDLLICLHESLQLLVDLNVLASEHIAVVLESIDLCSHVSILVAHGGVSETEVVLLASGHTKVVVSSSALGLKVVQVR